jgi:hypothetical protein
MKHNALAIYKKIDIKTFYYILFISNPIMNILFSDPFYHIIVHHLKTKDLYNLRKTCQHYKNTITKKYIKEFVLKNVKNELQKVLGHNYENFSEQVKKINDKLHTDENTDRYNTYFAIIFKNKYDIFSYDMEWYKYHRTSLYANNYKYHCDCVLDGLFDVIHNSPFEFFLISINRFDNKIIKTKKEKLTKYDESIYFFENDTNDIFNLSKYL